MEAKIFNSKYWVEGADAGYINHNLEQGIEVSGLTTLDVTAHAFEPYGYTGLWLLAESHLALHTFPEANKAYIELSSCNKDKQILFDNHINSTFIVLSTE